MVFDSLTQALNNPTLSEPQLVANMVCYITRALNQGLYLNDDRIKINAGGIFVHQRPQVHSDRFPDPMPHSVEIGDLLFIRTEIEQGIVVSESALLLQAKKVHSFNRCPDNKNQHFLYAYWPEFEYTRSGTALNHMHRHVMGADLYNGAKYLLIGDDTSHPCGIVCGNSWIGRHCQGVYTAVPTFPDIRQSNCFVKELGDFIAGSAGKRFVRPPHAYDRNWNRVIYDLIETTAKQKTAYVQGKFKGVRGQGLCFLRGSFDDLFSFEKGEFGGDDPPEVSSEWYTGDDEMGGISMIQIVVNDEREAGESR